MIILELVSSLNENKRHLLRTLHSLQNSISHSSVQQAVPPIFSRRTLLMSTSSSLFLPLSVSQSRSRLQRIQFPLVCRATTLRETNNSQLLSIKSSLSRSRSKLQQLKITCFSLILRETSSRTSLIRFLKTLRLWTRREERRTWKESLPYSIKTSLRSRPNSENSTLFDLLLHGLFFYCSFYYHISQ